MDVDDDLQVRTGKRLAGVAAPSAALASKAAAAGGGRRRAVLVMAAFALLGMGLVSALIWFVTSSTLRHLGAGAQGHAAPRDLLATVTAGAGLAIALGAACAVPALIWPLVARTRKLLLTLHEREILWRVRTSLRPRTLPFAHGEIAAGRLARSEAGGDYFDVISAGGSSWIAVANVEGLNLRSALVFLMIESVIHSLVRYRPQARPAEILGLVQEVLLENVHHRLGTIAALQTLLCRVDDTGLAYSGYLDILIRRRDRGPIERITPGAFDETMAALNEGHVLLAPGDLVLVHTAGVAASAEGPGGAKGIDRLAAELERLRDHPAAEIAVKLEQRLVEWSGGRPAPGTFLVFRYGYAVPQYPQPVEGAGAPPGR